MSSKKHYGIGDRVVCLHTGEHGWVASTGVDGRGSTVYHIKYDRMGKGGEVGAPNVPWSLLRPETFLEYLFMRRGFFGKWSAWQALLVYGLYGIVGYGGVRTITHFGQPAAGAAILVLVAGMVIGSVFLHYKNYHGKQA